MPRNPGGKEGRAWLQWVVGLSYGKAITDLSPKERARALKMFFKFCNPPTPPRGPLLTIIFRWVIPGRRTLPSPKVRQLAAFQTQAKDLIEQRLHGATQCRTGLGASGNYQEDLITFESQDPVYTAVSRFGSLLSSNWKYIKRCPRAEYFPKEWCRRVFVVKKLPEPGTAPYCSRRCRQRMQKREEDQIAEDRYGMRGRKPKEGA